VRTTVSELPDSRVKIDVAVEPEAIAKRVDRAAVGLAGELKLPGFRKGKVPPALVIQRLGREAVVEQALRDSLPEWYERALIEARINPIGDPKLDVGELPGDGEELAFTIEVAVRPPAELGEYRGLEVGRAEIEVPEEAVDAEVERLQEGFGSLHPVERPAAAGDAVVIDFEGTIGGEPFEGSTSKDFVIELGAEGLLPEFDTGLAGAGAGDERTIEVSFPDDHEPAELAGKTASFAVEVKEVREKQLPELNDEFAAEASEFDTLEELRADIADKIREALDRQAAESFRESAVDAAVEKATVNVPEDVVTARATEMWERVERSLAARGIAPESYLEMQDRTREDVIGDARPDAEQQLKREAVLVAVAEAESLEVSDDELTESLSHAAEHEGVKPAKLLEQLRSSGRDSLLREDLMLRKAADVIADSAEPIALEKAAAREQIWTPEKERGEKGGLWTPGDGPPPEDTEDAR